MKVMMKPQVYAAHRWFKNGDHPQDACETFHDNQGQPFLGEGNVVRYFRDPAVPGETACQRCGLPMHVHGWLDQRIEMVVCPGDWVVGPYGGMYWAVTHDLLREAYLEVGRDGSTWPVTDEAGLSLAELAERAGLVAPQSPTQIAQAIKEAANRPTEQPAPDGPSPRLEPSFFTIA